MGRYRRAAGDGEGGISAYLIAIELARVLGQGTGLDAATALASLSHAEMLDGLLIDAERHAADAIAIAGDLGDEGRRIEVNALTMLGVIRGWGEDPEAGVAIMHRSLATAERLGDLDEQFRAYANLTTVLDVLGRREEALAVSAASSSRGASARKRCRATSCAGTPPSRCSASDAGRRRRR